MSDSAVFFSDDLNYLADSLGQRLFRPCAKPFEKRLVIVPSQATKVFIQRRWAEKEQLGIAAGVDIVDISSALAILSSSAEGKTLPSSLEVALYLFHEIARLLEEGDATIGELRRYLENKHERLFPLCQQLARVFLDYGKYGEEHLEEWFKKGGWQAALFRAVYENSRWTYPLQLFASSATWSTRPHLFGFFSLPPAFARFLKERGALFYLFSPCSQYWGDFVSDHARARQALFLQKKGMAENQLAAFDRYVDEQHPLLANWGQAGRLLLEILQTEEMPSEENYTEKRGKRRLHLMQRSILNLDTTPCAVHADDSLQILSAPSRSREVETLLDVLKALMQRHAADEEPLFPGDILVLAPDITVYLPYIEAFFGSEESQVNYAISGIERIRTSSLGEAFRKLLGLLEERFDRQALLALFRTQPFSNKQKWNESDLAQIAKWIEKAGITWGYDGVQRAKITHATLPLEERGSWSFGLDRLLFGLTSQTETALPSALPLLEWTDSDLFGQLAAIVYELQCDINSITSEERRSLADWTRWTGQLIDRYFLSEEENWLHDALLRLSRSCRFFDRPLLVFADFCRIIDDFLYRCSGHTPTVDLQAVRFASLSEGSVLPVRMICLLGMQEGSFPRRENASSLCEIPLMGPSSSACDRYLFLETCLKARDYLWMSYVSQCPEEKVELMPSILVQELVDWLKTFFPSQEASSFITSIPFLAISREALEQFPFFSPLHHLAAQLYHGTTEPELSQKKGTKMELPSDEWPEEEEIRMEDLKECLRNPLSFYFSKTLKVRLKKEEKEDFEKEEFTLSSRQLLSLAQEHLTIPLDEVVAAAKQRGAFPMGEFEHVARRSIREKQAEIQEQMKLFGVVREECFSAILSRSCKEPKKLESGKWLLPAWELVCDRDRVFYVTGEIETLSPQGLVCCAENKASPLIEHWPSYLVLAGHPALQHIPAALIPVAKKTKNNEKIIWHFSDVGRIKEEMGKLLLYYQKARKAVSPFLSEWIPDFFGPFEKIEKSMRDERGNNIYVKWLEEQGPSYARDLCQLWRPYIQAAFQGFLGKFEKHHES